MISSHTLTTLEFDKIVVRLGEQATTKRGRQLCRSLVPSTDFVTCARSLCQTQDAERVLLQYGSLSLQGVEDFSPHMPYLMTGASLDNREILLFARFLRAVEQIRQHLPATYPRADLSFDARYQEYCRLNEPFAEFQDSTSNQQDDDMPINYLWEVVRLLIPLPEISARIDECILGEKEIADKATPELYHIRKSMLRAQDAIKLQLERILKQYADKLQECIVTLRGDRYVVPLKAEHKGSLPGVVHDTSSSGATIFVEPLVVVELNNQIRELQLAEEKEIAKILAELSGYLRANSDILEMNADLLARLDFVQAKAQLARLMRATMPQLNQRGIINLKQARHPLIDAKKVVPIDLWLGKDFHTLLITGPNTGGKTVSLKTCGLLTLMAQAGLLIPAHDDSQINVFTQVLADIGDEQSIEQSLSTFSSHMRTIIQILQEAQPNTLVLTDELGAGTDPSEGAALAIAILDALRQKGCHTLGTTHYRELKNYALNTPDVSNACCEFDTTTLSPTYRLLIGVPGVSNAFAISERLGLPKEIVEHAGELIDNQTQSFESMVKAIEKAHLENERIKEEVATLKQESAKLKQNLEQERQAIAKQKEKIISKAKREAEELFAIAELEASELMAELKASKKQADNLQSRQAVRETKQKIEQRRAELKPKPKAKKYRQLSRDEVKVGTEYQAVRLGFAGIAESLPDNKGMVQLRNGALSMRVHFTDLTHSVSEKPKQQSSGFNKSTQAITRQKVSNFSYELMLIGERVEEALIKLDSYLDDAVLSGLHKVRIVHGKGTGALRQAVRDKLKRDSRVRSFADAEFGEGDSGVTIVEL